MINDMLKIGSNGANVAVLSVVNCDKYYKCIEDAADVSKRFIQSAGLLPENALLGWQINADKKGKHHVFAFSGASAKVTQEDFSWIFQECASVEAVSQDTFEDMWGESRRVYALRYLPGECKKEDNSWDRIRIDYGDDTGRKPYYQGLFNALGDIGAVIRIMANAERGGSGAIMISLPDEMTLRMRAMLSLAFSDTAAIEIKASDDGLDDIERLPPDYLTAVMTGLLGVLMLERPKQEFLAECEEDISSTLEPEEEKDIASIDVLDLSVRAYNCLMRSGIRTVEDLLERSENDLLHIRNLSRNCTEEIKQKLAERGFTLASPPVATQSYSDTLDELIGLDNVKEQVKKITALAKMKQDMAALGKSTVPVVLNMAFVGNPGTAKTTVARMIAGIFHEIGLLSSNDFVEVGRADLVARYVGQTADQVKSVFRRAKGKLLFIDEAYALVEDSAGQFGDEAINTIVQEMENHREDTIVIFAGYPDKMEELFSRNPGLRSRVPFHIGFFDYSTDEMVQIAELEAKKRGFTICPEAREKVASICAAARHPDMGNGRFCRNLVEGAILGYASRVYGADDGAADKDFVLADGDFAAPEILRKTKNTAPIGFRA